MLQTSRQTFRLRSGTSVSGYVSPETPDVQTRRESALKGTLQFDGAWRYLKGTLQFDGAWRYSARKAGGGALVLDQFRNILCAKARKFNWGNRAKEIEALALEMGIDMAIESGIKHLTVEGDAETLLHQIAGRSDDNNTDRAVVKDIVDRI